MLTFIIKANIEKRFAMFVLILFVSVICYAENRTVTLTVEDEQHEPVIGAAVSLVAAADSIIVDAQITDNMGQVMFNCDTAMALKVFVRSIGYEPFEAPLDELSGKIILQPASNELSEVVVTARAQALKHKAGKFIFDPAELIKEMPSGYDVLRFTPLIEVNRGSFSILGQGKSTVYINGRNPNMSQEALIEMLKALPPKQIKSIEIVTAPGASHSASMSGGIINIILDRPTEGYLGSISTELTYYHERVAPMVSSWNGFSKGKFNMSVSVAYTANAVNDKETTEYYYPVDNMSVTNRSSDRLWHNGFYGNVKAAYSLTDRSEAGLHFGIQATESHGSTITESVTVRDGDETYGESRIKSKMPWRTPNYGVNGYYTLKTDDRGSNLDITVGYGSNLSRTRTDYLFSGVSEHQQTEVNTGAFGFNPKYKFVINDSHVLGAGYSLYKSRIDNDFDHAPESNRFIYKEFINSGYLTWDAAWSRAFNTSVGLRVENSDISGNQVVTEESFSRNYTDIFPSLSISLDLPWKGNQSISLDISRRIFRPFYSRLNPFVTWTSETTCKKGNPDLEPSYITGYRLYYSFLKNFTFGASYSLWTHTAMDYRYREGDVTVTSSRNFGTEKNASFFLAYNRKFFGLWRIKADAGAEYNNAKAVLDGNDLSYIDWQYDFSINNSIELSRKYDVRLEVRYGFRTSSTSITSKSDNFHNLSMSLSKMFDNNLSVSVDALNLLCDNRNDRYYSPDYGYRQHKDMVPITFVVNVNYVFGKRSIKRSNKYVSSPLDGRMGE